MATETSGQAPTNQTKQPSTNVVTLPHSPSKEPASKKAVAFVKKHPVIAVAGGLALGVVAAGLLNRRGARKVAGRAFHLAEMASGAAMLFGRDTLDKAGDAGSGAKRRVGLLAHQAERIGGIAAKRAEHMGHAALDRASDLGNAALNQSTKLIGYPRPAPTVVYSLTDRLATKASRIARRVRG